MSVAFPAMSRLPDAEPTSEDAHAVAWRLHRVTEESTRNFESIAATHGLTAVQARCVLRLAEPTRMQDIALHLGCDPSNVTGVAERLIHRGLVTSRPGDDRRVKMLELTPAGAQTRAGLAHDIARDSLPMTALSPSERSTLVTLLDKLISDVDEMPPSD